MRRVVKNLMVLVGFAGLTISPISANAQAGAGTSSRRTGCDLERNTAAPGEEGCDDFTVSNAFGMLFLVPWQPLLPDDQQTPQSMKLATGYRLSKKFAVPGEGGWDYIAVAHLWSTNDACIFYHRGLRIM
jgi:hypothetical protein